MPALPQYDSALLAALDEQAARMGRVLAGAGYARVEPSIVQPADVFLDRSGEEIRRRTFVFDDGAGNELCLRPDLTIPVCRMYLTGGGNAPAKFSYHGPAFRLQPNEPNRPSQFLQTGAENIGGERDTADIEVMTLAIEAVRGAGLRGISIKLGELGLFAALVDALDIPAQWRGRLKRHFWRPGYFQELLERLSQNAPVPAASYLANLGQADPAQARAALNGLLHHLGAGRAATIGGRTREEIVDRLIEQVAEAAAVRLDKAQVTLIENVLSVAGNARECVARTRALIKGVGGATDAPLVQLEARIDALAKLGFKDDAIQFAARFGRNMEYYTGFVFELWSRDAEGPLQVAGGGRYDTLLRALGAARDIPSVGCAIRDERVLAARRAAGGA